MYYLDTNTCIYFLNGRSENVKNNILKLDPSMICIPAIVKAELLVGAYKSNQMGKVLRKLDVFFRTFKVIDFTDSMTYVYADIRAKLEKNGNIIGPNDMLIAATALESDGILVTNNIKEFERVEGLKVANWTE